MKIFCAIVLLLLLVFIIFMGWYLDNSLKVYANWHRRTGVYMYIIIMVIVFIMSSPIVMYKAWQEDFVKEMPKKTLININNENHLKKHCHLVCEINPKYSICRKECE